VDSFRRGYISRVGSVALLQRGLQVALLDLWWRAVSLFSCCLLFCCPVVVFWGANHFLCGSVSRFVFAVLSASFFLMQRHMKSCSRKKRTHPFFAYIYLVYNNDSNLMTFCYLCHSTTPLYHDIEFNFVLAFCGGRTTIYISAIGSPGLQIANGEPQPTPLASPTIQVCGADARAGREPLQTQ
jgi:hypothetical protein